MLDGIGIFLLLVTISDIDGRYDSLLQYLKLLLLCKNTLK